MERWQGLAFMGIGCTATVWLGMSGQLRLYIHPRYVIFTTVMALIGLLFVLLGFVPRHAPDKSKATPLQQWMSGVTLGVCIAVFIGLLVIKPATLTTSTVNQRGINSGISAGTQATNAVPIFGGGDYTSFGVKDWAALLIQTNDPSFYTDKTAKVIGFISPDNDDPQNVFYVSRFVITCCAVDARPVGVPVYAPNWQATYKPDAWVQVEGGFVANPSAKSQQRVVIKPGSVTGVEQPKEPYVY
jgi:uncharacterized repeat protein (TIGR03943 family)